MRITFYGAAEEVGRSCVLVESSAGTRILLDAGVKLGEHEETPTIPDDSLKDVDAVLISHAHLDHCGYLPHLFSAGFDGPVYAIKPTLELINVIISDYLRISKPKDVKKDSVGRMQRRFMQVEYHDELRIKDVVVKFLPAGHILGSAMIELRDRESSLLYTGDMNLRTTRLLDPAYTESLHAKALLTESTYGGKDDIFPSERLVLNKMIESMKETIKRGGKVIIPSFAVGRAQEVLFIFDDYIRSGLLPAVPIYVDGMISKAMRIYRHNVIYCKDEVQKRILMSEDDPFKSKHFHNVKGKQERREIVKSGESCIIVTTSGMLKGGPVIGYIEALGKDERNKIILVGYQAVDTPGRLLVEGAKELEFNGRKAKINMTVENYHLSAHADRTQLLRLVSKVAGLKEIFIIHGEENKQKDLSTSLSGKYTVHIPKIGESFVI